MCQCWAQHGNGLSLPSPHSPWPITAGCPSSVPVGFISRETFHWEKFLSSDFQHFGFNKLLLGYSAAFGVSRTSTLILEGSNRNMVFVVSSSQDRQPCAPGEIGFSVDLGFLLLGVSERESHTSINQLCEWKGPRDSQNSSLACGNEGRSLHPGAWLCHHVGSLIFLFTEQLHLAAVFLGHSSWQCLCLISLCFSFYF